MSRALALVIGIFAAANVAGEAVRPGFDQNVLLLDLPPLPAGSSRTLVLLAAALLAFWAVRPSASTPRRLATAAMAAWLVLVALADSLVFWRLTAEGRIRPSLPVPLTLLVAAGLGVVLLAVLLRRGPARGDRVLLLVTPAAFAVLFPILQMEFFGRTDYRRPADVAVVFGARAYADGTPSTALADRVRTACRLWREGSVRRLLFSGGPGDGPVHETEAMRRLAISLGVDPTAIVTDPAGVSTRATVENSVRLLDRIGAGRAIAVSHAYHLPRVKMAFRRAGRAVFTVPAEESRRLRAMPRLVLREIAAFWAYWALVA